MELHNIRNQIDRIDFEMIQLLARRMEFCLQAGRFKSSVVDKTREQEVMDNVQRLSNSLLREQFLNEILRTTLKESALLQRENPPLFGFQGEHGAHSEMAAIASATDMVPLPCRSFRDVFEGVEEERLDRGIVPLENSSEGAVNEVIDLLIANNLFIVSEIYQPVNHCLLAENHTDHREIKVVYSHPQALGQCRAFLERNQLEARPYYDTAGAARMLAMQRPSGAAVIANAICEKYYDLKVLKENIQDESTNRTRFLVLSKKDSPGDGDKCSIVFSVEDESGALYRVLRIFAKNRINMSQIQSRPQKENPGRYVFFCDFAGSTRDKKVLNTLKEIQSLTQTYKFLGCYVEVKP